MEAIIVVPHTARNYDEAVTTAVEGLNERYGQVHTRDMKKWYTHDGDLQSEPATAVTTYGPVQHKGGVTMIAERVREITGAPGVMAVVGGDKMVV